MIDWWWWSNVYLLTWIAPAKHFIFKAKWFSANEDSPWRDTTGGGLCINASPYNVQFRCCNVFIEHCCFYSAGSTVTAFQIVIKLCITTCKYHNKSHIGHSSAICHLKPRLSAFVSIHPPHPRLTQHTSTYRHLVIYIWYITKQSVSSHGLYYSSPPAQMFYPCFHCMLPP